MSDETRLLVTPGSSLSLLKARSGLIARGLRDANLLIVPPAVEATETGETLIPEGICNKCGEKGLEHLAVFATVIEQGGNFVNRQISEADFQKALRDHLRSRSCQVMEGSEFGGGETDLLLMPESIVVENKVAGETDDPFSAKPGAPAQARRYSMAVLRRVTFVVIGYQPKTEAGYLSLTRRFKIEEFGTKTDLHATIQLAIPYGQPVPSRAKP